MKTAVNSCNNASGNMLESHIHDSCTSGSSLGAIKRHSPASTVFATSGKHSAHSVRSIFFNSLLVLQKSFSTKPFSQILLHVVSDEY